VDTGFHLFTKVLGMPKLQSFSQQALSIGRICPYGECGNADAGNFATRAFQYLCNKMKTDVGASQKLSSIFGLRKGVYNTREGRIR
jgi:hypothetical protein